MCMRMLAYYGMLCYIFVLWRKVGRGKEEGRAVEVQILPQLLLQHALLFVSSCLAER